MTTLTIYLTDDICLKARDKLSALMEAQDEKGITIQHKAADSLLRACLTQQRYGLSPQTPADFERATRIKNSEAQQLATMTEEDLLEQQRILTADYPGRPQ
jgi:hypothetical protein